MPNQNDLPVVNAKTGDTALHHATRSGTAAEVRQLLDSYSPKQLSHVANQMNRKNEFVSHTAASNQDPDVLKMILECVYPKNTLVMEVSEVKNDQGMRVVDIAALNPNPDVMRCLLALLPENQRLNAVTEKNYLGANAANAAARNLNPRAPEIIRMIFSLHPENNRMHALKNSNVFIDSIQSINTAVIETLQDILLTTLQIRTFRKAYKDIFSKRDAFEIESDFLSDKDNLSTVDMKIQIELATTSSANKYNAIVGKLWALVKVHAERADFLATATQTAKNVVNEYYEKHPHANYGRKSGLGDFLSRAISSGHAPTPISETEETTRLLHS